MVVEDSQRAPTRRRLGGGPHGPQSLRLGAPPEFNSESLNRFRTLPRFGRRLCDIQTSLPRSGSFSATSEAGKTQGRRAL